MQISVFNSNLSKNNLGLRKQEPAFKSAFPVVHWVRETNGSYAPALTEELNKKLQRIVVRHINSQGRKATVEKLNFINYLKGIISKSDKDFALNPVARSFYNPKGGWINGDFEPFGYIITGNNAEHFNETLGKPIGRSKSPAPYVGEKYSSAEVNLALGDYFKRGLSFVKKLAPKFKPNSKIPHGLHTKFEVVRTKTGRIKEFRLLDIKFCPQEGPKSPFVRTGYKGV